MTDDNKLNNFIITLYFFAFLHGSGFFILNPVLRPSFIIGPLLILALPMGAFGRCRVREHLTLLLATSGFVGIALFYLLFAHEQIQLMDFFYISALPCTLVAAQLAAEQAMRTSGVFLLKTIAVCCAVIIAGLLFEIASGTRLVATDVDYVFASIFNNPNDLGTVVVCFMPLVAYLLKTTSARLYAYVIFYLVSAGLLLVTMSRGALVIFTIFIVLHLAIALKDTGIIRWILVGVLATAIVYVVFVADPEQLLLNLSENSNRTVAENAKRLWFFAYNFGEDKSAGSRLDTYFYFFRNLPDALLGFGIKNYAEFFAGSRVMKLAEVNPHSFLIEVVLAFGIAGFLFILFIAGTVISALRRSFRRFPAAAFFLFLSALTFCFASNIPSSIFRLPVLWFPLFYMLSIISEFIYSNNHFGSNQTAHHVGDVN